MPAPEPRSILYRKKPIIVKAVQMPEAGKVFDYLHNVEIPYEAGDWIITGIKGERYACKDEVFKATYEAVEADEGCAPHYPWAEIP